MFLWVLGLMSTSGSTFCFALCGESLAFAGMRGFITFLGGDLTISAGTFFTSVSVPSETGSICPAVIVSESLKPSMRFLCKPPGCPLVQPRNPRPGEAPRTGKTWGLGTTGDASLVLGLSASFSSDLNAVSFSTELSSVWP